MAGITIRGLSKSFGANAEVAAVNDIDLEIKDNSFVTLLGPSGCGKTTTLRLIAGYIIPDRGTIEVDGRQLSSAGAVVPPESRGMGMVFQNYAVWPHKTVFENVVFGLKLRKVPAAEAKKKVEDTLAMVNLGGLGNRYPNELSGGQQQRVALARSLVVEPSILLLDEPLSNLDAKLREHMRSELKELQRRTGITFVYVTHDQAEALALSDQIAVMDNGRLQQFGTPHRGLCRSRQPHGGRLHGSREPRAGRGACLAQRRWHSEGRRPYAGDRRARRIGGGRCRRCRDPAGEYHPAARGAPRRATSPRSPTTSFSAISANITPRCRPVRRCGCRPIRASISRSATRSALRSRRRNAASSAVPEATNRCSDCRQDGGL